MKIALYDPLYSNIGHFERYNKYLVELLDEVHCVDEIFLISENIQLNDLQEVSSKVKIIQLLENNSFDRNDVPKNFYDYFKNRFNEYKSYKKIISLINNCDADLVFFSSQGNLSFWLAAVFKLKTNYIVSVISIKWLFSDSFIKWGFKKLFIQFLNKSKLRLFTEGIYKERYFKETKKENAPTLVIPDRFLDQKEFTEMNNQLLQMSTLGTVTKEKSPISFLESWSYVSKNITKNFKYKICGKVKDTDLLIDIKYLSDNEVNFQLHNEYLSENEYKTIFNSSDFIVIPYPEEYTRHATSGVMWDCFELKKPIICPDIAPFIFYINKYKIGYSYKLSNLEETLRKVIAEKASFNLNLKKNFKQMHYDFSKEKILNLLENELNKLC